MKLLGSSAPRLGHLSLLTDISGSGLSKRLGSLSLKDLRQLGFEPMAISSLLSKVGTSDPIDVFKDITQIIKEFDINKFGKSKPKFDKNELSNLNSKFFQLMDYEDIINKLKTMDLDITKEFWYLIRGNIKILDDVKVWMNVCFGNIQTKNIDD